MTRSITRLLLLSALAASAGCAGQFNGQEQALTVAEEHPISVDSQTVTMTMGAAGTEREISSLDGARLKAFADSYMRNGGGVLTVTAPSGEQGAAAGVRDALYRYGVPREAIVAADYRGDGSGRDIILSYTHYVATPSACGVWEGMRERDYRNMRSPNFGCATQNNLAAMIGDPHDLVEPAAMSDPDSATRIRGVEKFRKGEVTSSQTDSEVESKIAK
jgi:pilus assembly protein CpaD